MIVALALLLGYTPLIVSHLTLTRREARRRDAVRVPSAATADLGTRARVTETQELLRAARAAREEAHTAWSDAGKPS